MLRVGLADPPPPHEAHSRLARRFPTTFILESREGPQRLARYSFVGFDPAGTVECRDEGLHVTGALPGPSSDQSPLEYLRRIQAFYAVDAHDEPFVGGLVGSLGYGFAHLVEPTVPHDDADWPHFLFGLYLDVIVYDHEAGTATYVSRGEDRSQIVHETLRAAAHERHLHVGTVTPLVDQATFEDRTRRAKDLIREGECFQIVLSRAYQAPYTGGLGALYDWLRDAAAVPYLYRLRFAGGLELLGASPEMLVRVRAGKVETFPIAGTRPVVGDEATDAAAGDELLADRKEKAEHAMLVDLARNDLGRVCAPGSVDVTSFMQVERFRDVQHLVSCVRGDLEPGRDALDAVAAVFPAGTVSGAPKIRAMQHIAGLEARGRGAYAGAIAYLSFNGDFDSAIAIRSLSARDGILTVQAGAGIVHRSDPTAEFHETRHKSRTLLTGLQEFGAEVRE